MFFILWYHFNEGLTLIIILLIDNKSSVSNIIIALSEAYSYFRTMNYCFCYALSVHSSIMFALLTKTIVDILVYWFSPLSTVQYYFDTYAKGENQSNLLAVFKNDEMNQNTLENRPVFVSNTYMLTKYQWDWFTIFDAKYSNNTCKLPYTYTFSKMLCVDIHGRWHAEQGK